tara:strand:- start:106 stop:294 length:189 start_codon:yes stop_codon:yes gene_type:complete
MALTQKTEERLLGKGATGCLNLRSKALGKLKIDRRCRCRSTGDKGWRIWGMGATIIIKMEAT